MLLTSCYKLEGQERFAVGQKQSCLQKLRLSGALGLAFTTVLGLVRYESVDTSCVH